MLQDIEANQASTSGISGKLSILESSVVHYFYDLDKRIYSCQIVPHFS